MGTIDVQSLFSTRISRRRFAAGAAVTGGLALAGLGRPTGAFAAANFAPGDTVYTADDVNFRDAPSINGGVLTVLPEGTMLHIYDGPFPADGWTWYRAAVEAVDPPFLGYVAGEYLTSADTGGGPRYPVGVQIMVVTDGLNVRNQPGLGGGVVTTVGYGAVGTVTSSNQAADGYSWIEVQFSGATGWVAAEYVSPFVQDGPKFGPGTTVYVTSGGLNLRDAPSLSGGVITSMPESMLGTVLDGPVAADGWVWYKLQIANNTIGWAVEDYLDVAKPVEGDIGPRATIEVVDGPLNIRSGPGIGSEVIDRAATGAVATVIEGPIYADGYTWIKIDGNLLEIGWVAYEFCRTIW